MQAWWSVFATTFLAVFVAELGDKTQLAALGLSSTTKSPWAVFIGSACALLLAAAIAVVAGRMLANKLDVKLLHYSGAVLFLGIGLFMLLRGPTSAV